MIKRDSFTVDLADPDSIQKRLAQVEAKVMEHQERLRSERDELNYWETLYQRLLALSGQNGAQRPSGESVRERIRRIVQESDLPVDTDRVMTLMPANTKRKTVSWNLWDLEKKGEIQRVQDGIYARLDFKPPEGLLLGEAEQ
jgi:hypothetical protein